MNVGIVTTWYERGAAYVSRQFKKTLERAHNTFIYARGDIHAQGNPVWDTPQVTWGPQMPGHVMDLKDFGRWLQNNKIDLVLFNEQHSWPPVLFCNKLGIITGTYVDYYTEVTIPFFDCYDFLICNTKRHYSSFEWHPQCWYIPWGADLTIFKPTGYRNRNEGTDTIRFFHSSGLSPRRKGTDLVIQAFSGLDDGAHLIIHGQRPLKTDLPDLSKTIDWLRANGRLTTIEETVTAPGLYHLGDVYVYPSRLEGIGLTLIEALACGLPVITTDQPPMNEFVQPQKNGQVVAVDKLFARGDGYYWPQSIVNISSLREAMRYYILNADQLTTYQANSRQYAEAHLDWDKNSQVLLTLLADVKKRPDSETKSASDAAEAFEPLLSGLYYRYPTLIPFVMKYGSSAWRTFRGAR